MSQRCIDEELVELVLREGDLNERGDKVILSKKRIAALAVKYKRSCEWNKHIMHVLERLTRRGGMTIVYVSGVCVTAYFGKG